MPARFKQHEIVTRCPFGASTPLSSLCRRCLPPYADGCLKNDGSDPVHQDSTPSLFESPSRRYKSHGPTRNSASRHGGSDH